MQLTTTTTAVSASARLDLRRFARAAIAVAILAAAVALAWPLLAAEPAPLTSDESLYLAEGFNIASGAGPRYTTGEWVNHRAPLFPALLAIPMRVTGDPSSAYWVSKAVVLALAGAAFLLARSAFGGFGSLAGAVAALLVMSSAYLRSLGTTLYLDGMMTLFMLLSLAALWKGFETAGARWFALGGLLFGSAFLTKEAAIQWLPLPLAFALLSQEHRNRRVVLGLAVYLVAAGALMAAWWGWVYAVTGRIYFWGPPDARLLTWMLAALVAATAAGLVWLLCAKLAPRRLPLLAAGAGAVLLAGWVGVIFYHMEYRGSWPFSHDYFHSVPRYLWQAVAPNTQPWPLVLAAVLWTSLGAASDKSRRLLALALILYLPFAVLVANRGLHIRDWLPLTYVGYVAAAGLAATCLRWAADRAGVATAGSLAAAGIALIGMAQTDVFLSQQASHNAAAVTERNWDNPLVHDTAAWIGQNVPPGAGVMASRLYFSHLYVLDDGQHPIYQLPTVRVEPRPDEEPFLRPMSTMFRWEDHRMGPAREDQRWLYVRRYPLKDYYVALSEWDLLSDLRERDVDYLVLTGEDAGFSSLTYLDYFTGNQAFALVHEDVRSDADAVYVFRVDRDRLAPRPYATVVSEETLTALSRAWPGASLWDLVEAISPAGVAIRPTASVQATGASDPGAPR